MSKYRVPARVQGWPGLTSQGFPCRPLHGLPAFQVRVPVDFRNSQGVERDECKGLCCAYPETGTICAKPEQHRVPQAAPSNRISLNSAK
ncbi:hypothetical protein VUR80DRAFT_4788 [Thermomyces stellatus]